MFSSISQKLLIIINSNGSIGKLINIRCYCYMLHEKLTHKLSSCEVVNIILFLYTLFIRSQQTSLYISTSRFLLMQKNVLQSWWCITMAGKKKTCGWFGNRKKYFATCCQVIPPHPSGAPNMLQWKLKHIKFSVHEAYSQTYMQIIKRAET